MDQAKVQAAAAVLEAALAAHAGSSEAVRALWTSLQPLLERAKAGAITSPVPWEEVPGSRPFLEGEFAEYPDVEDAYSAFKMVISGEEDLLNALR